VGSEMCIRDSFGCGHVAVLNGGIDSNPSIVRAYSKTES
jgi:hypothetical protein